MPGVFQWVGFDVGIPPGSLEPNATTIFFAGNGGGYGFHDGFGYECEAIAEAGVGLGVGRARDCLKNMMDLRRKG